MVVFWQAHPDPPGLSLLGGLVRSWNKCSERRNFYPWTLDVQYERLLYILLLVGGYCSQQKLTFLERCTASHYTALAPGRLSYLTLLRHFYPCVQYHPQQTSVTAMCMFVTGMTIGRCLQRRGIRYPWMMVVNPRRPPPGPRCCGLCQLPSQGIQVGWNRC